MLTYGDVDVVDLDQILNSVVVNFNTKTGVTALPAFVDVQVAGGALSAYNKLAAAVNAKSPSTPAPIYSHIDYMGWTSAINKLITSLNTLS
jgi:hypothetical protein